MASTSKGNQVIQGIELQSSDATVDPVAGIQDFRALAAEEAFMNEPVVIRVAETTDENQPPHVMVNCNGVNQPLLRGVPTRVKRKYVEILARMKETKYRQSTPNPSEPDRIVMNERTALVYPFEVLEDANPKGRAWLNAVLADPA